MCCSDLLEASLALTRQLKTKQLRDTIAPAVEQKILEALTGPEVTTTHADPFSLSLSLSLSLFLSVSLSLSLSLSFCLSLCLSLSMYEAPHCASFVMTP